MRGNSVPYGGAKGAGSWAAQHVVMVFGKSGAARAEWGGGFSMAVENGLGWPLAIDEFEHGKFTAVGEVFVAFEEDSQATVLEFTAVQPWHFKK